MENEKKNNSGMLVGILIGIIIMLLVFVGLFATGTIGFKTSTTSDNDQASENDNQIDNNKNEIELSKNYCDKIIGEYIFSESIPGGGDINGITSASYEYKLSITEGQSNCNATLEINGFQTFNRIKLDIEYNNEKYNFIFNTYADGDVSTSGNAGTYNKGDILFSLYNDNNNLYTHWDKYIPHVESNKTDGIYFKKS
ncbi:MAG: DUF5991 domain-containing protein [Bacilli bacterium]|nr:DUF5991 domain-containing protein [Bacilli bacterium]